MRALLKIVGFCLLLAVCFGFGFGWRDLRYGRAPSSDALNALVSRGDTKEVVAARVFRENYERLLTDFVGVADPSELKWSGMEGLFAAVGDPHTMFLRPRAAEDFMIDTSAQLVGVGARLSGDQLGAKVATVFEDGPAARAGLKTNDVITAVDDKPVVGLAVDSIVEKVRGVEGTVVKLQIVRMGVKEPIVMTIKRAKIIAPTVEASRLEKEQIGVLKVLTFSQPTARQFASALTGLERAPMKGLVVDLRNNPGGLLETTVELLSLFLDQKVVVKMKMRDGIEQVATTRSGEVRATPYPIVVLIDRDSASASEIFAGVLRDYQKATLVGEHSYGKASVQDIRRLIDGSSAKITIARYYLPSSADIGRKVDEDGMYLSGGLQPDVKVALPFDRSVVIGDPATDTQLKAAIDVIQKKR